MNDAVGLALSIDCCICRIAG